MTERYQQLPSLLVQAAWGWGSEAAGTRPAGQPSSCPTPQPKGSWGVARTAPAWATGHVHGAEAGRRPDQHQASDQDAYMKLTWKGPWGLQGCGDLEPSPAVALLRRG